VARDSGEPARLRGNKTEGEVRRVSNLTPTGNPHGARATVESGGKTARRRPAAPAAAARLAARVRRAERAMAATWETLGAGAALNRSGSGLDVRVEREGAGDPGRDAARSLRGWSARG
jgi:hypothetical protein